MLNHEKYLKEIGIDTQAVLTKLTTVYNTVSRFCPEPIDSIFASEYRNSENKQVLESIYLISENYLMEIKQPFGSELNWDIINYKHSFEFVQISSVHLIMNRLMKTVVSLFKHSL